MTGRPMSSSATVGLERRRDAPAPTGRRARPRPRSPSAISDVGEAVGGVVVVVDDEDALRARRRRASAAASDRGGSSGSCAIASARQRQLDDELAAVAEALAASPTRCRRAARPGCGRSRARARGRPASGRAPAAPARTGRRCAAASRGAMPMPWSRTRRRDALVRALAPRCGSCRPGSVYFAALVSRFEITCARRSGSPSTARPSGGTSTSSVLAPLLEQRARHLDRRAHDLGQLERARLLQLDLAARDARDVEQVVDQARPGGRPGAR